MNIRTDLALEARAMAENHSVKEVTKVFSDMKVTEITVKNPHESRLIGKDIGTYITFEFSDITEYFSHTDKRIEIIGKYIRKLLPEKGSILVVGLGNRSITPDALGVKSAEKVIATRHMDEETAQKTGMDKLRRVSVIMPGVLGQTGIETAEFVLSIVNKIKPSAVIAVDALASRQLSRLGCTLQISDAGISPGAGVNNHRFAINRATTGVPVIAIGIPTVVDALTLACDIMPEYVFHGRIKDDIYPKGHKMIVTPQNIDVLIEHGAELIGLATNAALYENLSLSDIVVLSS